MLPAQFCRTWLFVPGDDKKKIEHAAASGADAVILDWEDAVLAERKSLARQCSGEMQRLRATGKRVLIRINSCHREWHSADLEAAAAIRPDGVMLPKCESAEEIRATVAALPKTGGSELYPIIESPRGLLNVSTIATACDRVCALAFGAQDFCAAAEIRPTPEEAELLMAKSTIVVVARAYGLAAIDSPVITLDDPQLLRDAAQGSSRLGFTGKLAIHPKQVPAITEAFAPTPEEVQHAEEILQQATIERKGVFAWKGRMVDEAILERARHILQRKA